MFSFEYKKYVKNKKNTNIQLLQIYKYTIIQIFYQINYQSSSQAVY